MANPNDIKDVEKGYIANIEIEPFYVATKGNRVRFETSIENTDKTSVKTNDKRTKKVPQKASTEQHALYDKREGQSQIEQIANRIETRMNNRIGITKDIRVEFLHHCGQIKKKEKYVGMKIRQDDLVQYRNEIKQVCANHHRTKLKTKLGFFDKNEKLLEILNEACNIQNSVEDNWFYYGDFSYFNTRLVSSWPCFRSEIAVAATSLLIFFICTPILFCTLMNNDGVCPSDPTERNRSYYRWVSALYFASTTMSTVGYGDLSVFGASERPDRWVVFIGALYMLLAITITLLYFKAAADSASNTWKVFGNWEEKLLKWIIGRIASDESFIHQKLKWVRLVRVTEIVVGFFTVNFIGIIAIRIYILAKETRGSDDTYTIKDWTWMDTFYWAIQTTTTIGYGDMDMSFNMRWFQIIYLLLSTYSAGSVLGCLGSLSNDLAEIKSKMAWENRAASKHMIEDFQPYDNHDDKVDQFEFVISSLVMLKKVSYADVNYIMNKYRTLEKDGFISLDDIIDEEPRKGFRRRAFRLSSRKTEGLNAILGDDDGEEKGFKKCLAGILGNVKRDQDEDDDENNDEDEDVFDDDDKHKSSMAVEPTNSNNRCFENE